MSNTDAFWWLCSSRWHWTGSCGLSPKEDARAFVGHWWQSLKILTMLTISAFYPVDTRMPNKKLNVFAKQPTLLVSKSTHRKLTVLRKNTRLNDPVKIEGRYLEDVEEFAYLGTKVTTMRISGNPHVSQLLWVPTSLKVCVGGTCLPLKRRCNPAPRSAQA